jgi:hypothetical protein
MWILLAITLLVVLVWLTRTREAFIDVPDLKEMPNPEHVFKQVRSLLDKYDRPEIWAHAAQVADKDPGQLARMNLDIHNA